MIWDGESRGTFRNIVNLSKAAKPAAVYLARTHEFVTVSGIADLDELLTHCDAQTSARLRRESRDELPVAQLLLV